MKDPHFALRLEQKLSTGSHFFLLAGASLLAYVRTCCCILLAIHMYVCMYAFADSAHAEALFIYARTRRALFVAGIIVRVAAGIAIFVSASCCGCSCRSDFLYSRSSRRDPDGQDGVLFRPADSLRTDPAVDSQTSISLTSGRLDTTPVIRWEPEHVLSFKSSQRADS